MIRSRTVLAACLASLSGTPLVPAAAFASMPSPTIAWHGCPTYSDAALRRMMPPDAISEFTTLWARTECGTISVPLDYRRPAGRRISVAVTRLRATDQAHRLGSLALNPGGPGGSGYLTPLETVTRHANGNGEELNRRYDLIGFDPRGVGYSTKLDCPAPVPPLRTPITRTQARTLNNAIIRQNRSCAAQDPAFLSQLTTENIARDLDRIRAALGERKLSYLGISWGTWLGVNYRNLFPDRVHRMWLDSPAPPEARLDRLQAGRAKAQAEDTSRAATWIAARNAAYGLGTTRKQVETAIAALEKRLDARPKIFTDLPGQTFDGTLAAQIASQPSIRWPESAGLLKELRDAESGTPAPPLVKRAYTPPPGPTPSDVPERFNPTLNHAVACNEDTGPRDLTTFWTAYQKYLKRFPVTGTLTSPVNPCAGWPLPVHPVRLHRSGAPLVMSAHRHEVPSPYPWALQTRAAVGGSLLTVDDDVHGSTTSMPSDCAPRLASYFLTGHPRDGRCQGVPLP